MSFSDINQSERIKGGTDGTLIGNVGDRLKTETQITLQENFPVTLPEYEDFLYRIRTTQPRQIFQAQWAFNGNPLSWSQQLTGSASIEEPNVTGHKFINFKTSAASGDKVIYQTKRCFRYTPHRLSTLTFAAAFREKKTNLVKRIGIFDDQETAGLNGICVEQDATGFSLVIFSTASGSQETNRIRRTAWNVDKLDGNGPSGENISDAQLSNGVLWNIDFSWYGVSGVQLNVIVGGRRLVCHEEVYTFTLADRPFMTTAFLPLRIEIENTGAVTGGGVLTTGSINYDIENGEEIEFGYQQSVSNQTTDVSVSNTGTLVLALRPKATVNSLVNRGVIRPNNVDVLCTADTYLEILVGGTVTGGTWIDNGSNSIAEYNVTATGYSGGRKVRESHIATGGGRSAGSLASSFPSDLFVAVDSLLGDQLAVAIRATRLGGGSDVYGSIGFREIY